MNLNESDGETHMDILPNLFLIFRIIRCFKFAKNTCCAKNSVYS